VKIHQLQNPPAGLTFLSSTVETVELVGRNTARLKLRIGAVHGSVEVDVAGWDELPAPGEVVNVSLWQVP